MQAISVCVVCMHLYMTCDANVSDAIGTLIPETRDGAIFAVKL